MEPQKIKPVFLLFDSQVFTSLFGNLVDTEGIVIRTGHHCCQPLMQRLGHESTARASFSIYNTEEDVAVFSKSLLKLVKILA